MDRRGCGVRAWAIAGVLASGLAACSGDDGASVPTTADASAAPTTAPVTTSAAATTATTAPTTVAPPTDAPTTAEAATTAPPTPPPTVPPATAAPPPPVEGLSGMPLALAPFADVELPTALAARPGDAALYVTSQDGRVWRIAEGTEPELVLDLTDVVSPYETGSERGLLGIAFDPSGERMFLSWTDHEIDSHVESYAAVPTGPVDRASARDVLFIDQPGLGHKGGSLAFGADGHLYISSGDGGASSGRDAQDFALLLGGILRIAPKADGPGYDVPADNPYVGQDGVAPELWAKGLRNPWGMSIDRATGDLWTADVGNHLMEEIDRAPAGAGGWNFGWPFIEGTEQKNRGAPADVVPPVHAYRHDDVGPAAIGGRVYRGSAIPSLHGAYLFADMSGPVFAIGAGDEVAALDLHAPGIVTGFGTDSNGEVYVLTLAGGVSKLVPG